METPIFVVTGAPNKGKSTFLKAMTNDPSIEVGEIARTTVESKAYHFTSDADDQTLMTFWDTPGFENASEVYELFESWKIESSKDPLEIIQKYIDEYEDNPNHKYEVEIFKPMRSFAGIIYIADCSKSFSDEEYLREIQLLQLTNLPRIAILNPILGDQHLEAWREGLRKYFHTIKVFNPHKTTFDEKLSVLGALSHLNDEWEEPINNVIKMFEADRESILNESARIIRSTILKIYSKEFEIRFDPLEDEERHKEMLLSKVREYVQKTMNNSQNEITKRFGFDIEIGLNQEYQDNDLFSETVRKRNISKNQRGLIGGASGAVAGGIFDAILGGTGLGIPTVVGAGGGYLAGYLSGIKIDDLIDFKNPFESENKNVIQVKLLDVELGFLIINRLRQVVSSLYNRTAANRERIDINKDLDKKSLFKIGKLLTEISKSERARHSESNKTALLEFIYKILKEDQEAHLIN